MTKEFWDAVCIEVDEDLKISCNDDLTLLIDADIIAYQAAATTDGRQYTILKKMFKYKKDAVKYCEDKGIDPSKIQLDYFPEPEMNMKHNIKVSVESLRKLYPKAKLSFYISGSSNFRNSYISDYKANRKDVRRPHHLSAAKQYILNRYKGEVMEGLEADDIIGCRAEVLRKASKDYVVCSIDKDLDMIPGKHYNWRRGEEYEVTEDQGLLNFYCQCLTGDKTDNIPGLIGIGPVKAKRILENAKSQSPEHLWEAVVNSWWSKYPDDDRQEVYDKLLISARLLWILREPYIMWQPPVEVPY